MITSANIQTILERLSNLGEAPTNAKERASSYSYIQQLLKSIEDNPTTPEIDTLRSKLEKFKEETPWMRELASEVARMDNLLQPATSEHTRERKLSRKSLIRAMRGAPIDPRQNAKTHKIRSTG